MSPRMSAALRREEVLRAARIEFGLGGYAGTSTEAIARRVGVSQPYLFRLFPTKQALFIAVLEDCSDSLAALLEASAAGLTGEAALMAMGRAYNALLDNKEILQIQLQMWSSACQDEQVRQVSRRCLSRLFQLAERVSGADSQRVMRFIANGALLNVLAALEIPRIMEQLGTALAGPDETAAVPPTGASR